MSRHNICYWYDNEEEAWDAHYIADSNRTALMNSIDGGKDVKDSDNIFQLN